MIIGIDMGHCLSGEGTGAQGCGFKEEVETRKIGKEVIAMLKKEGHTVIDCTVDKAKSNSEQLNLRVSKANKQKLDLFVSIHFNACVNDQNGDGKTTGTEVYIHSMNSKAKPYAERIANNLSLLGLKNRGIKLSKNAAKGGIAVIDRTSSPALLIETCFIDDRDDMNLYTYNKFATSIVEGILNKTISYTPDPTIKNGWIKFDAGWSYYINDIWQTGWIKDVDRWYYLNEDGYMATGWVQINGKWYYLDTSGVMLTGWQLINNKWYFMKESGEMISDTTIKIDTSGAMV